MNQSGSGSATGDETSAEEPDPSGHGPAEPRGMRLTAGDEMA